MGNATLFLTLRVFSATGGIEKVSRVAGKALHELASGEAGSALQVFSMYDETGEIDERYFPAPAFRGFAKNKLRFVASAIRQGMHSKQVILSHANLLLAGFLIKLFSPDTRLILIAHGIEVWSPFSFWKRYMLGKCDQVLAVSQFTKDKINSVHGITSDRITVLNNCLDPFLAPPLPEGKNQALLQRYGLTPDNIVLLTITRLSSKEQYKGYDNVLHSINILKENHPGIRYLLVGKYDAPEKIRVDAIVKNLGLSDQVIFTGFIPEDELAAHYNIADCYIMPSKKEGFGIVFIEAMYYGKPVIAGNTDGSVDALDHGNFGILVNPDDISEITNAIVKVIRNPGEFVPDISTVLAKFSYPVYKENLRRR